MATAAFVVGRHSFHPVFVLLIYTPSQLCHVALWEVGGWAPIVLKKARPLAAEKDSHTEVVEEGEGGGGLSLRASFKLGPPLVTAHKFSQDLLFHQSNLHAHKSSRTVEINCVTRMKKEFCSGSHSG